MRHPSIHKSWHYISSTSGGRSVGIVRLQTKGHRVFLCPCGDTRNKHHWILVSAICNTSIAIRWFIIVYESLNNVHVHVSISCGSLHCVHVRSVTPSEVHGLLHLQGQFWTRNWRQNVYLQHGYSSLQQDANTQHCGYILVDFIIICI
jgi:hypothetical protein